MTMAAAQLRRPLLRRPASESAMTATAIVPCSAMENKGAHTPAGCPDHPLLCTVTSFAFALACLTTQAQPQSGSLDVHWNEGAPDCTRSTQPPLQVHRYDANTYLLR